MSQCQRVRQVRSRLWLTESFPVYLRLLEDPIWFVDILQCFQFWRREEPEAVTRELCNNVEKVVNVLSFEGDPRVPTQSFQKALEPLVSIVQESPALSALMVDQGVIPAILAGLRHDHPYIRGQLLMLLLFHILHYPEPSKIPDKDALINRVKKILVTVQGRVKDICTKILKELQT